MKKTIVITATLLALTACGTKTVYVTDTEAPDTTTKVVKTTDAPVATPAPTLPPVTQPAPIWTEEDEFLYDIETSYYGTIYVADYEMIKTGRLVCDSLLSGLSADDVVLAIMNAGGDTELITSLVASAVTNFCPSQLYKFENL